MIKRSMLILTALILVWTVVGCKSKAKEEPKVPVKTASVDVGDVVQLLVTSGEIHAEFEVKVFSKIPDRIEKYYVDIGSRVAAGSPIAKIYAATLEQGVRQAEGGAHGSARPRSEHEFGICSC